MGDEFISGALATETTILPALERSDIPAPRLIGSTSDAADAGPAVLMTRVPGRIDLMPHDRESWLRQMAQTLARIHALDIDAQPFESWLDRSRLSPPPDASRPDIWREAIALVGEERAPTHTCFIHRDYQHFNLLWSRERLTGVIDWVGASVGPPDVDVGHCRLNLTVLFSADVAERFRLMYEAEAGRKVDPWWDIQALLSFGPGVEDIPPDPDRRPRATRRRRHRRAGWRTCSSGRCAGCELISAPTTRLPQCGPGDPADRATPRTMSSRNSVQPPT